MSTPETDTPTDHDAPRDTLSDTPLDAAQRLGLARFRAKALALPWLDDALRDGCAEVGRLTRELAAAREIIDGRTTPPTGEEIAAHGVAWLISYPMKSAPGAEETWTHHIHAAIVPADHDGEEDEYGVALRAGIAAEWMFGAYRSVPDGALWWPLDSHGRPCAWPEVTP